jgi:hypothetical protein
MVAAARRREWFGGAGVSLRQRLVALALLAVVLIAGTAAYLVRSKGQQELAVRRAPHQNTAPVASVASGPRIVFRNTAIGPDYGKVAMVRLDNPGGARAITTTLCDRVFAVRGRTLCLGSDPGLVTKNTAKTWADAGGPVTDLPLTGVPSRARLSNDAALAATTSFVAGDSYSSASFSTRTVVSEIATGANHDPGKASGQERAERAGASSPGTHEKNCQRDAAKAAPATAR